MSALMRTCVGAAGRIAASGAGGASGGGWGGSLARISRLSKSCRSPAPVTVCVRGQHSLPDLPYDYDALEPVISAEIMRLHHSKHHQTYVNNLNVAEARLQEAVAKHDVSTVVALQPALRFNGGGHINHSIFWQNLRPVSGPAGGVCLPEGALLTAIQQDFGGVDQLQQRLSTAAVGVQGSGWAWLAYDPQRRCLCVSTCANQDPLQATTGQLPLFGIDVWEHAYYLQYKNARADYVREIFKIANWPDVAARLAKATAEVH